MMFLTDFGMKIVVDLTVITKYDILYKTYHNKLWMKLKKIFSFIIKTFKKYNKNTIFFRKYEKTRATQTQILKFCVYPKFTLTALHSVLSHI